MNKEEKLLAISQLVFELSITSSSTTDLDALLERLFGILCTYREFSLQPRGAVVLLNPRGRYFQVAQFGMEPGWKSDFRWETGMFAFSDISEACVIEIIPFPNDERQQGLLLPLRIDGQGVGYTVLFTVPDYQPTEIHLDFMSDLARALSGLVQRALTSETLRIRELELEEARADALRSLGVASEYRDNETGWHIMRMTNFAQAIAKAMDLPSAQRELLYVAAPMHDVGKIGIADAVLLKPGKFTPEEFETMKTHTQIGVTILAGSDSLIAAARDIAGSHHERWDGKGYPQGLSGEQIPILARICSVADVFDALTSRRPYKEPWTVEAAHDWILSESGKYFDPAVVRAFEAAMPEILRIRELYRDDIIDPKQVLTLPPLAPRADAWVAWDDSLSVGIDIIDEHHRYLFDLINDLHDVVSGKRGAREVARLVKSLDAYAKVHFRAEEQMMTHYGFTGLARQKEQHHAFEAKIHEFYEELHANPLVAQFDVLAYLRDWLVHHIRVEDAKLRALGRA
ncbi:MAG: bacteriohemerythrin [Gallionella sp.]|jgi:hemerythrin-like metal-binding protein|nr:bacteriohemerythrin [Gallionella sp.]MCK9353881.1 bacteriohemerythrin [Gallionella sp.]